MCWGRPERHDTIRNSFHRKRDSGQIRADAMANGVYTSLTVLQKIGDRRMNAMSLAPISRSLTGAALCAAALLSLAVVPLAVVATPATCRDQPDHGPDPGAQANQSELAGTRSDQTIPHRHRRSRAPWHSPATRRRTRAFMSIEDDEAVRAVR